MSALGRDLIIMAEAAIRKGKLLQNRGQLPLQFLGLPRMEVI